MKPISGFLLLIPVFTLAACSSAEAAGNVVVTTIPVEAAAPDAAVVEEWDGQVMLVDEQGAVTVEVTPLNLANPGETLDFQVSMNTHSVDLSMDLAALSALTTNTNLGVIGLSWDGPQGGHHVSGTLKFPVVVDGQPLLDGADRVTLTIGGVDGVERTFTWSR